MPPPFFTEKPWYFNETCFVTAPSQNGSYPSPAPNRKKPEHNQTSAKWFPFSLTTPPRPPHPDKPPPSHPRELEKCPIRYRFESFPSNSVCFGRLLARLGVLGWVGSGREGPAREKNITNQTSTKWFPWANFWEREIPNWGASHCRESSGLCPGPLQEFVEVLLTGRESQEPLNAPFLNGLFSSGFSRGKRAT